MLIRKEDALIFFDLDLENWLVANLKGQFGMGKKDAEAPMVFAVTSWLLWKQRNGFVFHQQVGDVHILVTNAICMVSNLVEAHSKRGYSFATEGMATKWRPPDTGWIKVNTDGAARTDGDWSATASVLRDSNGSSDSGFQRFLGKGSALNAELWAILDGLKVAKHRNHNNVVIGSDYLVAVKLIKDCLDGVPSETIVRKIKTLAQQFEGFEVLFVRRKGNMVADFLSKTCSIVDVDIWIINVLSTVVRKLLLDDCTVDQNA